MEANRVQRLEVWKLPSSQKIDVSQSSKPKCDCTSYNLQTCQGSSQPHHKLKTLGNDSACIPQALGISSASWLAFSKRNFANCCNPARYGHENSLHITCFVRLHWYRIRINFESGNIKCNRSGWHMLSLQAKSAQIDWRVCVIFSFHSHARDEHAQGIWHKSCRLLTSRWNEKKEKKYCLWSYAEAW